MDVVVKFHGVLKNRMGYSQKRLLLEPGMLLQDVLHLATQGRLNLWTNQESSAKEAVLVVINGQLARENTRLWEPRYEINVLMPNIGG